MVPQQRHVELVKLSSSVGFTVKVSPSIPIKQWLTTQFRPLMEELLDDARLLKQGYFDARYVRQLKREHLLGRANHSHVIWSLIVFQKWHDLWFERR